MFDAPFSSASRVEIGATAVFACAIVHVFACGFVQRAAARSPARSFRHFLLHWLGEPELVFAWWAIALIALIAVLESPSSAISYLESREFGEPLFVLSAIAISGGRPVLAAARAAISFAAKAIPGPASFYFSCLVVGPLLGSLVTEPAAITVTALLLRDSFQRRGVSMHFRYLTLAVLFVNVSIGGTLTEFAAPPVLMVAKAWGWTSSWMLLHFGWKATLAVIVNAAGAAWILREELKQAAASDLRQKRDEAPPPVWTIAFSLVLLAAAVAGAHHPVIFLPVLGAYLIGALSRPRAFGKPKLREGVLVALFLGGLVLLGGHQRWWLETTLRLMNESLLFVGSTLLTAIVDNAALTYLGAQIPDLSLQFKYSLVAGAVAGGGLTLVANAPNPAGYSILRGSFGEEGVGFGRLFAYALAPTLVAMAALWFLPSF